MFEPIPDAEWQMLRDQHRMQMEAELSEIFARGYIKLVSSGSTVTFNVESNNEHEAYSYLLRVTEEQYARDCDHNSSFLPMDGTKYFRFVFGGKVLTPATLVHILQQCGKDSTITAMIVSKRAS